MFNIGDKVICVREDDLPEFIGLVWHVVREENNLFYCRPENRLPNLSEGTFVFRPREIMHYTRLMSELV